MIEHDVNEGATIIESIKTIIKAENLDNILLMNDEIRPGYLLLWQKVELKTTKKIFEKITEDMEIVIIPMSHGG